MEGQGETKGEETAMVVEQFGTAAELRCWFGNLLSFLFFSVTQVSVSGKN